MSAFLQRAYYRSSQFFKAIDAAIGATIGAWMTEDDRILVESVLVAPAQRALFDRMPAADQSHSVALLNTLRAGGHDHPALMQAALLHDAAKSGAGITVFHRVAVVLLRAFRPTWLAWLVCDSDQSVPDASVSQWRRPFVRYVLHPAIGADWAEAAGCHPMAVSLIRRHQSPVSASDDASFDASDDASNDASDMLEDQLLGLLQAADDQN
jgi:hypothetical protein